jgi:hypothetical protein
MPSYLQAPLIINILLQKQQLIIIDQVDARKIKLQDLLVAVPELRHFHCAFLAEAYAVTETVAFQN